MDFVMPILCPLFFVHYKRRKQNTYYNTTALLVGCVWLTIISSKRVKERLVNLNNETKIPA